jgi:hypothetical protein
MAKHGAGELGEKSLDEIEPGAVFGRVDEREASFGLLGEPSHRLLGFVGGVIVEDELDRGRGRMGGVELFQEFDEFARAMSPLDAGVDDAGHQIDAGQQALRPQSNVLVIACDGPMTHGLGRQVGRLVGERLDARLLVIGDDRDSRCFARAFPRFGLSPPVST